MFLEERVEHLEHLATDQGRQIETIAKGLADLTIDVRNVRQDVEKGFKQVNDRLDKLDSRFDEQSGRFDEQAGQISELKGHFDRQQGQLDDVQETQRLILKLLNERLS